MSNFILLIACLLAGFFLRYLKKFGPDAAPTLNVVLINLCLPAATLLFIHRLRFDASLLFLIVLPR